MKVEFASMKNRKRRRPLRFQGFVVHEIDPSTGERTGETFMEILTDSDSHEAGRDRAKARLTEMLDTHPQRTVGFTEYDEAGQIVG